MKYRFICVKGKFGLNTRTNEPLSNRSYYLVECKTEQVYWVGYDYSALKETAKLFHGIGRGSAEKIIERSEFEEVEIPGILKTNIIFNPPHTYKSYERYLAHK